MASENLIFIQRIELERMNLGSRQVGFSANVALPTATRNRLSNVRYELSDIITALYVYIEGRWYYFIQDASEVYDTAVATCSVRIVNETFLQPLSDYRNFKLPKIVLKQFLKKRKEKSFLKRVKI